MVAQEEMKKHNYAGAIAELKKAVQAQNIDKNSFSVTSGNGGTESAYDKYIINQMMAISYYSSNDLTNAAPLLRAAALSPYSNPDQTKQFLPADMEIYYQDSEGLPRVYCHRPRVDPTQHGGLRYLHDDRVIANGPGRE